MDRELFNQSSQKPKRQQLRLEMTKAEQRLWLHLRGSSFDGYKFRRQQGVGSYIVDFYCPSLRLVIEIDGDTHSTPEEITYDQVRTSFLNQNGIRVIRFTNNDVYSSLEDVLEKIREFIRGNPLSSPLKRGHRRKTDMFELLETKNGKRRGRLTLPHGVVETPCFMPIATTGAVKTLSASDVKGLGASIVLSNTYHLMLRPGLEGMKKMGGLHKLMGWSGPILTDSGGYQVFSLAKLNKTNEEGVEFQSHIDGARITLTPESSMEMQSVIGSDIVMQFDDVAAGDSTRERYEEAMERSLRWAKRCRDAFGHGPALSTGHRTVAAVPSDDTGPHPKMKTEGANLFGIVQGGVHEDLRLRSIEGLKEIGFDGYAIGGLSVGEKREDAYRVVDALMPHMPADKPRYFMGGGMPEEIVHYVHAGVDMFDCVLPTRNARHGTLFVWNQAPDTCNLTPDTSFYSKLNITAERFAFDDGPIDPFCDCETCKTTSRAYLRHLFSVGEMLAFRLATIHNLRFYLRLMEELRK